MTKPLYWYIRLKIIWKFDFKLNSLLLFGEIEQTGMVLGAAIIPLLIRLCRIVILPIRNKNIL